MSFRVPTPPPMPPLSNVIQGLPPELLEEDEYTEKRFQKELQFRMIGAIERSDVDKLKHLMAAGVDTSAVIQLVKTPLTLALDQTPVCPEIIRLLLESKADPNLSDTTPWKVRPLLQAIQHDLTDIAVALIEHGADLQLCDKCLNSPLHFAAQYGRQDILKYMLAKDQDLDVNMVDNVDKTPLHRACEQQNFNVASILIRRGALVNCQDKNGQSPIFHSIMFDHIEIVRYLINEGADLNVKNNKGDTPLHIACKRINPVNCRNAIATSFDFYRRTWRMPSEELNLLIQRSHSTNTKMLQLLINAGADMDAKNLNQQSPISLTEDTVTIGYLLAAGAKVNEMTLLVLLTLTAKTNKDLQDWAVHKYYEQFKLTGMIRNCIRLRLAHTRDIGSAVTQLPLPQPLKDFLCVHPFVNAAQNSR